MRKIVVATNNEGKIQIIKNILKNDVEILSLRQINYNIEVIEDGRTFEENAIKKAKKISDDINMPCISDDSGLCIRSLNGWPGIKTARFLGKQATDRQKNEKILEKMKNIEDRTAYFECCMAFYNNGKVITQKEVLKGKISLKCRGNNGFGFDEIFELENGRTLAELSVKEKNLVEIRKNILEKLKKYM